MRGASLSLITRNCKLFFRDRGAVFFSLLSVVIIIALYVVFLGDVQMRYIEAAAGRAIEGTRWLVNSWILAGILAVSTVTISLGAYGTMVNDGHGGQVKDFFASPIRRSQLVTGYMISSALISLLMSLAAFIIAEGYIALSGGRLLEPPAALEALGVMTLSIFAFSSVVCFTTSFVKTPRALGALSTILGTMIGFITGIYLPMGELPDFLNTMMKFIPFTYSAVWLRKVFTLEPIQKVFAGAPDSTAVKYQDFYGINIYLGATRVETWMMALIIAGTGVLFFTLSVWRLSRKAWIAK
jgi:multidrug/hemolysin transport system permease protein